VNTVRQSSRRVRFVRGGVIAARLEYKKIEDRKDFLVCFPPLVAPKKDKSLPPDSR